MISNARILLACADPEATKLLTDHLNGSGHAVCAASTAGQQTVDQAADIGPDLALIDLDQGPGGVAAAERITGRFDLPVVYLVGDVDDSLLDRARMTEPFGYVLKPVDRRQLRLSIDAALAAHARRRAQERATAALEQAVTRLQRRCELLETAFDGLSDGVAVVGEDSKFVLVNRAVSRIVGGDPATEDPNLWPDVYEAFQPDERTPLQSGDHALGRAMRTDKPVDTEVFVRRRHQSDGVHLAVRGRPLHDAEGRVQGAALVIRDITPQKATEAELSRTLDSLRQQADLLESVFNGMKEGITVYDASGRYLMLNEQGRRIVGGDMPQALERLSAPRDFRHAQDMSPCAPEQMPTERVLRGETFDNFELCLITPDQDDIYVSVSGRPLLDRDGSTVRGGVNIFRNVTRERKRENELRDLTTTLQAQKQTMEIVFDCMSDAVVAVDEHGKFTIFNRSARRGIGMGPTDTGPDQWSDRYGLFLTDEVTPAPPDALPLARAMRGESSNDVVLFARNEHLPEGGYFSLNARPLQDADGNPKGGVIVGRNVTRVTKVERELKMVAERWQQQNQLMEMVFDCMSDGVVAADEHGRFTIFNPSAERIVGRGATDTAPGQWSGMYGLFLSDQETPAPPDWLPLARALRGESSDDVEMFVRNENLPGGAYISVNGRPLQDADGNLQGGVIVFRDVTRLREAEQKLQQQNQLMEMVFDSISDGVVAADSDGKLMLANPSARRMAGMGLTDADSSQWSGIYGTFFPDGVTPVPSDTLPLVRALTGKASDGVELFLRNPHVPQGVHINVNGRPMRDASGNLTGGVIVFRDTTPRVAAREALQEAFTQGRLEIIDTVLHNIGNAINSVATGVETIHQRTRDNELLERFMALADAVAAHEDDWIPWLSSDPQGRNVRGFLLALVRDLRMQNQVLRRTASRVSRRVRHIVDVIRTQESFAGGTVERKAIHLREAIADAVRVLHESLAKRAIRVVVDCGRAPDAILVQESKFHQMLINLVKNSIEAIDELANRDGGFAAEPCIRIVAYVEGDHLALDVIDNGIGVEPEFLKEVFAAGYTTKKSGSGLGLHSAANYVIGSGGHVMALSRGIGQGTTMRVMLRLPETGPAAPDRERA